jgi:diamine N-acetyltransferase
MTRKDLKYRLRTAGIHDGALLSELGARAFSEAFEHYIPYYAMKAHIAATYNHARQMDELTNPAKKFLIAEADGLAVGYALLHSHEPPPVVRDLKPVELARLYLLQGFIGRGLGRALMLESMEESRRSGHESIWLAVLMRNERALAFYRNFGFETVGTRANNPDSSGGDDLIMTRML